MKIRRADRGSLRALFLLSSRYSASRCRRYRVAALVRLPEAFLRVCRLLFRREISERPSALDRQRRTPTKGRIQNTPSKLNRAQSMNRTYRLRAAPGVWQVWVRGPFSQTPIDPDPGMRAKRLIRLRVMGTRGWGLMQEALPRGGGLRAKRSEDPVLP